MEILTHLIFPFENEDVCDTAEGDAKMDDFTLRYFVGDVSDVDNPRKFAVVALVEFNLCTKFLRLVTSYTFIQNISLKINYNSDSIPMLQNNLNNNYIE